MTLCVQHHQIALIFVIFMTYDIIFFAKQTKVIGSVYLFINQHYTQILHKQLLKDRLLDALLMIYNKSIYTQRSSDMESHLKDWSQLCKSCDRKISARPPGKSEWSRFRLQTKPRPSAIFSQPVLTCSATDCINTVVAIFQPILIEILQKWAHFDGI